MDILGVCILMLCRVHWCKTSLTTMMNIWPCLTSRYLWPRRWKGKMNCSGFATDRNQYLNNHTAEALSVKGHQICEFNTEHYWHFSYFYMLLLIVTWKETKTLGNILFLVISCVRGEFVIQWNIHSFMVWVLKLICHTVENTVLWCGCLGRGKYLVLFVLFLFLHSEQKLLLFCSRACFFPCKCVCLSLHDVTGIKVTVECKCTE